MKFLKIKHLLTHGVIQKKQNLVIYILMNYLIFNITNFHQELKERRMKNQVGLLIQ